MGKLLDFREISDHKYTLAILSKISCEILRDILNFSKGDKCSIYSCNSLDENNEFTNMPNLCTAMTQISRPSIKSQHKVPSGMADFEEVRNSRQFHYPVFYWNVNENNFLHVVCC